MSTNREWNMLKCSKNRWPNHMYQEVDGQSSWGCAFPYSPIRPNRWCGLMPDDHMVEWMLEHQPNLMKKVVIPEWVDDADALRMYYGLPTKKVYLRDAPYLTYAPYHFVEEE